MKPTITFDKSAAEFMLKAFGKTINKKGYIIDSEGIIEKCGICEKDLNIKHLAGVMNNIGFVCNNISCLFSLSDFKMYREKKKKKSS